MPKEVVQYPREYGPNGTEIRVHWARRDANRIGDEGLVQIEVQRHVWEAFDVNALVSVADINGYQNAPVNLIGDSMTRVEINKLIATLRRARDQAFGRDE